MNKAEDAKVFAQRSLMIDSSQDNISTLQKILK